MRFLHKKAVILAVAVLTVFLLAVSTARGKYNFVWSERIVTVVLISNACNGTKGCVPTTSPR